GWLHAARRNDRAPQSLGARPLCYHEPRGILCGRHRSVLRATPGAPQRVSRAVSAAEHVLPVRSRGICPNGKVTALPGGEVTARPAVACPHHFLWPIHLVD